MDQIFYYLTLSDQLLEQQIFPSLPIQELTQLCQVNQRFRNICNSNLMWALKTQLDYPQYVSAKPDEMSSRDYYIQLYQNSLIPVYRNGDPIDKVNIMGNWINPNQSGEEEAEVFVNANLSPIVIVQYPEQTVEIVSQNFGDVRKIVQVPGRISAVVPPPESHPRGRKPNPSAVLKDKQAILLKQIGQRIINELTSPLSQVPIYGFIENGKFRIMVSTQPEHSEDWRRGRRFRDCSVWRRKELIAVLNMLQYQGDITEMNRDQLCEIIQNELIRIGHIV